MCLSPLERKLHQNQNSIFQLLLLCLGQPWTHSVYLSIYLMNENNYSFKHKKRNINMDGPDFVKQYILKGDIY